MSCLSPTRHRRRRRRSPAHTRWTISPLDQLFPLPDSFHYPVPPPHPAPPPRRKRLEKSTQAGSTATMPSYVVHGAETTLGSAKAARDKARRIVSARVRRPAAGSGSVAAAKKTRSSLLSTNGLAKLSQSKFSSASLPARGRKGRGIALGKS